MSSLEIQATCIPEHTDKYRQAHFLHRRPQDVLRATHDYSEEMAGVLPSVLSNMKLFSLQSYV